MEFYCIYLLYGPLGPKIRLLSPKFPWAIFLAADTKKLGKYNTKNYWKKIKKLKTQTFSFQTFIKSLMSNFLKSEHIFWIAMAPMWPFGAI